ncbi:dTDP-4-dehydrorhamnose reductase [Paraburkholderia sp. SARCC-3016]|uniref:dTDP-4-dehydrorhamnose reductase n=1 Tax=Paraburkholderia sp. SARCC-3016 TaxID=3058611 RepID=UPI0028083E03|nr:dTDP-4-dehydrorhamnose reductase [Paraburkholderia sp. SARCC-3016]MDQ7978062.1 dTDP-4-dehydrorhamnose reductase [Paraburkholderia sp. SARCC-3016]
MAHTNEPIILVTGATGQVGFELLKSLQGLGRIVAPDRKTLNLADSDQIRAVVSEMKPALVVNPAAYTAVDQAESDRETAARINSEAPRILAEEARRIGAALIHYSTDYVFDGAKNVPYDETDATNPLNVYGQSKLDGERAIQAVGGRYLIFRTSWVYGTRGRNFLRTMLRLARDRSELSIVGDQFGAPTWSTTIAAITAHVAAIGMVEHSDDDAWWEQRSGIYHLTSSGATSWAAFAEAIFKFAAVDPRPSVKAIGSDEYPAQARRPKSSRMSNDKLTKAFGIRPPSWEEALRLCIAECGQLR